MFFVVNKTRQHITLGDIGITLGPRQAVDLDRRMKRSKADESKHLKAATKRGQIEIKRKDMIEEAVAPVVSKSNDLNKMKDEIIQEMKELMKRQSGGGVSKEDLKVMAQTLLQGMPKPETVIIRQRAEEIATDEEVEMDGDVLGEINKRVVNEIVKDVIETSIQYKEEKTEDTILENVEELEGLLD